MQWQWACLLLWAEYIQNPFQSSAIWVTYHLNLVFHFSFYVLVFFARLADAVLFKTLDWVWVDLLLMPHTWIFVSIGIWWTERGTVIWNVFRTLHQIVWNLTMEFLGPILILIFACIYFSILLLDYHTWPKLPCLQLWPLCLVHICVFELWTLH